MKDVHLAGVMGIYLAVLTPVIKLPSQEFKLFQVYMHKWNLSIQGPAIMNKWNLKKQDNIPVNNVKCQTT